MNIQSAIIKGTNILKSKCILSAQLDVEILLSKVIGKDKKYIILNNSKKLSIDNVLKFEKLINERSKKKPVAYLIFKKFIIIMKFRFYPIFTKKKGKCLQQAAFWFLI